MHQSAFIGLISCYIHAFLLLIMLMYEVDVEFQCCWFLLESNLPCRIDRRLYFLLSAVNFLTWLLPQHLQCSPKKSNLIFRSCSRPAFWTNELVSSVAGPLSKRTVTLLRYSSIASRQSSSILQHNTRHSEYINLHDTKNTYRYFRL